MSPANRTPMTGRINSLIQMFGGTWGEHPDYPVRDWKREVDNNDTRLGYWEWVVHQLDSNS